MAKPLSDREREKLDDLGKNFDRYVAAYRERKQRERDTQGPSSLEKELEELERYLDACASGEVADVLIAIEYQRAKAAVLRDLLDG